jgi:hypothetical protein
MRTSLLFVLPAAIGLALSCGGTNSGSGPKDAAQNGGSDGAVPPGPDGRAPGSGGVLGSGGTGGVAGAGGGTGTGDGSVDAAGARQGTGGAITTGGNTAIGGASATGGMNATGGATARGGATSSGGVVTTGGNAAGGNTASGGRTATGGATAAGGQTASGGRTANGGTTATGGGGGTSTGGITSTGGSTGAGGATSSGGSTGSGGISYTGGSTGAGGATSSGGSTGSGGISYTGGSTGAGGATSSGGSGGSTSLAWEFASDAEGWICDFAEYPPNIGTGYDLECGWSALPAEVGPGGGVRMSSNNHSDDMFMYLMRQITGLAPQTTYLLDVVAVIDTNAPADCGGIGGSPGGSVAVKIGAVNHQPTGSIDSLGWLLLDIDKGNQSNGGADMKVVGNLGNSRTCPDQTYEPKTYTLSGFRVTSASDGTLWLILGTDSGFEGVTTVHYDRIAVTVRPGN